MEIRVNIPDQDIIDCLITALEGGSNYWYHLPDLSMTKYPAEDSGEANIFHSVMDGVEIPVEDIETNKLLGYITKENIERGIKLFIEDGRRFDPGMDADEADVLFQFIVMGEIVYG